MKTIKRNRHWRRNNKTCVCCGDDSLTKEEKLINKYAQNIELKVVCKKCTDQIKNKYREEMNEEPPLMYNDLPKYWKYHCNQNLFSE